jgi:CBS domain-containing protein
MRIQELMSNKVRSCSEDADLATVAKVMWDGDVGFVPVLNEQRHLVGVITDRDICIAAATRALSPASIRVRDVMSRDVSTCRETDDIRAAVEALKGRRVRRIPIVDHQNRLVGILSTNDLVARAEFRRGADVTAEECLEALKVISAHRAVAV